MTFPMAYCISSVAWQPKTHHALNLCIRSGVLGYHVHRQWIYRIRKEFVLSEKSKLTQMSQATICISTQAIESAYIYNILLL